MSQIYKRLTAAGPIPPNIPTEIETDDGNATPEDNTLSFTAFDSSENDDNGITIKAGANAGNPPDDGNGAGNEVSWYLTNRITGATTTEDADPNSQSIFDLGATPGVYTMWGKVVAFNIDSALGASWDLEATVRTDGVAGTEIAVEVKNGRLEGNMAGAVVSAGVGTGLTQNFFVITIQGYNTDEIHWNLLVEYRFVS